MTNDEFTLYAATELNELGGIEEQIVHTTADGAAEDISVVSDAQNVPESVDEWDSNGNTWATSDTLPDGRIHSYVIREEHVYTGGEKNRVVGLKSEPIVIHE